MKKQKNILIIGISIIVVLAVGLSAAIYLPNDGGQGKLKLRGNYEIKDVESLQHKAVWQRKPLNIIESLALNEGSDCYLQPQTIYTCSDYLTVLNQDAIDCSVVSIASPDGGEESCNLNLDQASATVLCDEEIPIGYDCQPDIDCEYEIIDSASVSHLSIVTTDDCLQIEQACGVKGNMWFKGLGTGGYHRELYNLYPNSEVKFTVCNEGSCSANAQIYIDKNPSDADPETEEDEENRVEFPVPEEGAENCATYSHTVQ
ncbi:hypothetical protein ACFL21_00210 [Patescibacteria group bacterium]